MDLPPPLDHVFVDYENVQAIDLAVIGGKSVTFTLLLGAQKKKLDVELVEKLVAHAASVHLVRLTASGRNALDFALAYYVGRAVAADPGGSFHIVSKDTGYDPLIEHLRSRHIRVRRHDDFTTFSSPGAAKREGSVAKEALARVLDHLRKNTNNRPKRRKTLVSHLSALLGKQRTEGGIEKLIDELIEAGHIAIDAKGAVTYTLPSDG